MERGYRDIKANVVVVMNATGANANEWLLVLKYVIFIHNHMAVKSLGWKTPLEALTGQTPDISIIYQMPYRIPIHFLQYEGIYPHAVSSEVFGYFVGFAETVGHSNTFLVLTADTGKVLARSRLRLAEDRPNKRLLKDSLKGEGSDKSEGDNIIVESVPTKEENMNPFIGEYDLVIKDIQLESSDYRNDNNELVKPLLNIPFKDLV